MIWITVSGSSTSAIWCFPFSVAEQFCAAPSRLARNSSQLMSAKPAAWITTIHVSSASDGNRRSRDASWSFQIRSYCWFPAGTTTPSCSWSGSAPGSPRTLRTLSVSPPRCRMTSHTCQSTAIRKRERERKRKMRCWLSTWGRSGRIEENRGSGRLRQAETSGAIRGQWRTGSGSHLTHRGLRVPRRRRRRRRGGGGGGGSDEPCGGGGLPSYLDWLSGWE